MSSLVIVGTVNGYLRQYNYVLCFFPSRNEFAKQCKIIHDQSQVGLGVGGRGGVGAGGRGDLMAEWSHFRIGYMGGGGGQNVPRGI